MTTFVLTGPAPDFRGRKVLRADLIAAIQSSGRHVASAITDKSQVLISSRRDTVKARAAAHLGADVYGYGTLYELLSQEGVDIPEGSQDSWVDSYHRRWGPSPIKAKSSGDRPIWHEPQPEPDMPKTAFEQSTRALQL